MGSCGELTSDLNANRAEENFGLPDYKVPFEFREPYILSGYRRPKISAWECFHSLFKRTNETINVWSHVVAFAVIVWRSIVVFTQYNPLHDAFVYPLLSFVVGTSAMFFMSSGAHLFNSMSSKTRHVASSSITLLSVCMLFLLDRPFIFTQDL